MLQGQSTRNPTVSLLGYHRKPRRFEPAARIDGLHSSRMIVRISEGKSTQDIDAFSFTPLYGLKIHLFLRTHDPFFHLYGLVIFIPSTYPATIMTSRFLLDNGADVSWDKDDGETPLHDATAACAPRRLVWQPGRQPRPRGCFVQAVQACPKQHRFQRRETTTRTHHPEPQAP